MDDLSTENIEEIKWLRLKNRPAGMKKWYNTVDIIEREEKLSEKDFLEKCQTLEDVENSMCQAEESLTSSRIKYKYSKNDLLKLRTHPLSMKAPTLQDNLKFLLGNVGCMKSKPQVKKHSFVRPLIGNEKDDPKAKDNIRNAEKVMNSRGESVDESRKSADPKERIKKEQDICLSPQRKSFNTGCFVDKTKTEIAPSTNNNNNNKSNTERESTRERENRDHGESRESRESRDNKGYRDGSRRIGSGRIIARDPRFEIRGYPDSSSSHSDYQHNRSFNKEIPTVVYERKFQSNSFERDRDREKDRIWDKPRMFNNYDRRRQQSDRDDEEEEPEWMKEGPVSLNDVIELKGFDENDEKIMRNCRNSKINTRVFHKSVFNNYSSTKNLPNGKGKLDKPNSDSDNSSITSDSAILASKKKETREQNEKSEDKAKIGEKSNVKQASETSMIQFSLEDILKLDPLPDMNADGNESAGSKFTRWFKREEVSTPPAANIEQIGHPSSRNGETSIGLQSEQSNFGRLSALPSLHNGSAESTHSSTANTVSTTPSLLDLLRGSQENTSAAPKMDMRVLEATGKLHSVEEIEAKLRGSESGISSSNNPNSGKKKKEEEAEAFKKLLSQAFHGDKKQNEAGPSNELIQKTMKLDNAESLSKLEMSQLCNGESQSNHLAFISSQAQRLPSQSLAQQNTEMMKLLQFQQATQQQQQEAALSKVLMSSNSSTNFSPVPSVVRPPNVSINNGPFSYISQEIQMMINSVQPTRELVQRPETVNILRALKNGEVSHHQLIEQLKKITPYQVKFRESVLCVLKIIQMQYYSSASVVGSPVGVQFNIPPPAPLPPPGQPPFAEGLLQQMILNSQFRLNGPHSGIPNVVYQRDFQSANQQNLYQNNPLKKHLPEPSQNVNQNIVRMNSPTSMGSNVTNATNSSISAQDDKNAINLSTKPSSTTQSLSLTPTSVLRKLSADKENLDSFSKDPKESKTGDMNVGNVANLQQTNISSIFGSSSNSPLAWNNSKLVAGEKNAIVPYTSTNSSNVYMNQGVIDHFNGFGTCIPPPAISGQYFVGNMIRHANITTQIPLFNSPPPPILSRLPVPQNSSVISRGTPKVSTASGSSQFQQLQQIRSSNSQLAQMIMNNNFNSNANRKLSDVPLSNTAVAFGNQNLPTRSSSTSVNGILPSAEEQMARWFNVDGNNLSRSLLNPNNNNVNSSTATIQNILSVEEIERMQQSVRN